jgi:hypothetical protein
LTWAEQFRLIAALEKDSQIKDVIETTDNPFDLGKIFWELIQES